MKTIPMRGEVWQDYDYSLAVPAFNEAQLIVACEMDIEHALFTMECNIEVYSDHIWEDKTEDDIMYYYYLRDREWEIYDYILHLIGEK